MIKGLMGELSATMREACGGSESVTKELTDIAVQSRVGRTESSSVESKGTGQLWGHYWALKQIPFGSRLGISLEVGLGIRLELVMSE